jgi:Superinfection immunity protein
MPAMMTFMLTLFLMYWLPTIIAIVRHTPSALGVAALNFFLGWTVIGWIMALVWALASSTSPHVIVIENGRVVRS